MRPRQVLLYAAGLFLLAWALGSLARSGGGGGILLNSYWLLYLVYLLPLVALGAMVVMAVYLAYNWKLLSDAIGFGIAAKRRNRSRRYRNLQLVVWLGFWGLALGVLFSKCGGIFCTSPSSNQTLTQEVKGAVASNSLPNLPVLPGELVGLTQIIGSGWFELAFLGLLAVCSVIAAKSVLVSLQKTGATRPPPEIVQEQGTVAIRDALKLLEDDGGTDPRTRILACYQRMIRGAANLGAPVAPGQTARELEAGIRSMFMLKRSGIHELTRLFEEARYSLHTIREEDSEKAHGCLLEIGEELRLAATV